MDDESLWAAFTTATLPSATWTHEAHLRIAWLFLAKHDRRIDEAHVLMRVGIVRLNAFHGLVETVTRGYHETLTRVWLALVLAKMGVEPSSLAFLEAHGPELGRDAVLRHYSKDVVMGLRARATFVPPDLAPLPHG